MKVDEYLIDRSQQQ